jgi:hypothetical protein
VGHFGRAPSLLDMVDKDCPFNSIGQVLDRLTFFFTQVLSGESDQQGADGAQDISNFFAYAP